ncbi:hypothetical protein ACFYU8_26795 [Brevibacillus sp. NPDC003359]|uniref:hypothetical protein n=1 Tax=unclassified Brevibacillus TaxID=2684853 RepID=UPI00369DCD2F
MAVGISNSGETSQIITTMKQARKSGAVTIGITKYGTNSCLYPFIPISPLRVPYLHSTHHVARSALGTWKYR